MGERRTLGLAEWMRRRRTVRVRTTAAAVGMVGLAMVVGSAALVVTLRGALVDDVRSATLLRAREIAEGIEAGDPPALGVVEFDEQFVQVLDGDGMVVAASTNIADEPAIVPVARTSSARTSVIDPPIGDEDFIVAVVAADAPRSVTGAIVGPVTVVYGRSLDEVGDSVGALTGLLAVAGPVLVLLVGVTTWFLVGRALAPVEAIRAEVERISSAALDRRVPEPETADEIARLASTMNDMLGRLEAGHARQRSFVADASHELRSPVASLRQHAEVAHAHPDRVTVDELAAIAIAETARLQRLVDDLLLLARADERALEGTARAVDVDDAVFAEAGRLRAETDLTIDTRAVSAGRIRATEPAVARVVRNLAENAARHASATVAMSLREVDGTVELTVDDDGPGIPAAHRSRVFERFVRLDDARGRDAGGSGLGLAIVAELVTAFGGRVLVTDSPLGGARLVVRFPAVSR